MTTSGSDATVLLVEDNPIIAIDAEDMLRRAGAESVHVAGSVIQALSLISATQPAFAVLDINLGEETSFPVADTLQERTIPFVFATAYGEAVTLPERHTGATIIAKPYDETTFRRIVGSRWSR